MAVSFSRPQPGLPPRLQPGPGNIHPVRSPGVHGPAPPPAGLAYEHYRPHPPPRPPRGYGPPRLDTQFFMVPYLLLYLRTQGCPILFLEICLPAEFRSNLSSPEDFDYLVQLCLKVQL